MDGNFSLVQLVLSSVIFLVMFFGIAFLINMLLRMTWAVAIAYPIIILFVIDDLAMFDYFAKPSSTFQALGEKLVNLQVADYLILGFGLLGTIIAGFVIKYLRKNGYQMF
ncbi:YuiB family protein [Paenisporosarcina cavernae]|uniref:Membrane protein YuiB n=1 Tax=Paenisporosarcina cavernae TaxID=2320858 RepID=A0A385YTF3_9BACL|nr:YuiB family protein [Paenisporosarcina cavernae]AYC29956.1 hypothetical protein D3873_08745 [Paenisporosarcina cavernae]